MPYPAERAGQVPQLPVVHVQQRRQHDHGNSPLRQRPDLRRVGVIERPGSGCANRRGAGMVGTQVGHVQELVPVPDGQLKLRPLGEERNVKIAQRIDNVLGARHAGSR